MIFQAGESTRHHRDPRDIANEWRRIAEAGNLTTRGLIIKVTGRQSFVGSASTIAAAIGRNAFFRSCMCGILRTV